MLTSSREPEALLPTARRSAGPRWIRGIAAVVTVLGFLFQALSWYGWKISQELVSGFEQSRPAEQQFAAPGRDSATGPGEQ